MKTDAKRTAVIVVVVSAFFVLGGTVLSFKTSPRISDSPTGVGRFQISRPMAEYTGPASEFILLLDTATGDTCRFRPWYSSNEWHYEWTRIPNPLTTQPAEDN